MLKKQNQSLLPFSSTLLVLISILCSTTLAAISPAAQSTPPTTAPTTPLVPTLPQPPSDTPPDIIGILKKANSFNIFIRLMKTTQLINQLNSQLLTIKSGGGLTILSPDDSAFSELKLGFLNSLSDGQKLELLQFHVIPDFVSSSNFDTLTNPVRTLAGNKPGKVELNVISYGGGNVNISTGQVNTTVNGIIYSDKHLAIYKVGKVLLPSEFFPKKKTIAAVPSLAPAPATEAPKPQKEKPASSEDSSESSSQVVPTVTSGAASVRMMSKCAAIVVGAVFVLGFYNIN